MQPVGDVVERLVPVDALEAAVGAALERVADALGIGVEVLQRVALRADVPAREVVVLVAADRRAPPRPTCVISRPHIASHSVQTR